MLDVCYYNSQIKDELDGAADYYKRANIFKTDHPDWSALYSKMAEAELEHASSLMKIFEDDYKFHKTDDPIYESIHSTMIEMYTQSLACVKAMHHNS